MLFARRFTITRLLSFLALLAFSQWAAALPPGFQQENLLIDLNEPVHLTELPDARMLLLQKGGQVLIFDPAGQPVQASDYLTITDIDTTGEHGLTSLALDPDFEQNGIFYLYYTHGSSGRNRISRFNHAGDSADPGSEVLIWEASEDWSACCHMGGGLGFGPDGKLYLTTGEDFDKTQSPDLTRSGGKIIRINKDGSIPADNPFADGPGGNLDEIWAYGLRNPFRATWDHVSDRLYFGDVGGNDHDTAREEINIARAGANYGWPDCEGQCTDPAATDPLYDYGHDGINPGHGSVTAGFVYRGNNFPSQYSGAFFLSDYSKSWIRYLLFNPDGSVASVNDFSTGVGAPVHLIQGSDGALYYVHYSGRVRRIVYNDANQAPIVHSVSATPQSGSAPFDVNFSIDATDPEGDPISYTWLFGDGDSTTGASPSHTYTANGTHEVYVEVSDGNRTTLSEPVVVYVGVGNPPTASIDQPVAGSVFRAGDTVDFSGSSADPDETIAPENYVWDVIAFDGAGTTPVLNQTGIGGQFEFDANGYDGYRLMLTVTDSTGLQDADTVEVFADNVDMTFVTSPAGIPLILDGVEEFAPFTRKSLIGHQYALTAPASWCLAGVRYDFTAWSDGGPASHPIIVPKFDETLTATFTAGGACGGGNQAPVANDDTGSVARGGTVTLDVLANDSDPDGTLAPATVVITADPLYGSLTLDGADGSLTYAHDGSMTTSDGFSYEVSDDGGLTSNAATVNISVIGSTFVDVQSIFNERCVVCHEGHTEPDLREGNAYASIVGVASAQMPALNWIEPGSPDTSYLWHKVHGTQAGVGGGGQRMPLTGGYLSEAELESITNWILTGASAGGGGNLAPVANDDSASVADGGSVAIDVLANDFDIDGVLSPSTVMVTTNPANGDLTLNAGDGSLTYTHDGSPTSSDSFSYRVSDDGGLSSNVAVVTVSVQGGGPAQLPVTGLVVQLETDSGVTVSSDRVTGWADGSAMGNDLTAVGDPRFLQGVLNGRDVIDFDGAGDRLERTANLNGLPAGNADRTVVLLANYRGTGRGGFAYGTGIGSPNTCDQTFGTIVNKNGDLTVQGWCNDFTSTHAGTGEGWLVQSAVLEVDQLTHYRDGQLIDARSHTYDTVLTNMVLGAELDGKPFVDMQVAAVLVYNRALGTAERGRVLAYLQGKYLASGGGNQPPVANGDSAMVASGESVVIDILANDLDPDGALDPPTVAVTANPANGVLAVNATDGSLTYTHNGSASMSDSFTYQVSDDGGLVSNQATVTLTVYTPGSGLPTAGLVVHLEAEAGVSTTGDTVDSWADQSGMGNDLTGAGDPRLLPDALNGRAAIDFDGANDGLERTANLNGLPAGNADRTVFLLANYRGTGNGGFEYGATRNRLATPLLVSMARGFVYSAGMNPDDACDQAFGTIVNGNGDLAVRGACSGSVARQPGTDEGWLVQSAVLEADRLSHYRDGQLIDARSGTLDTVLKKMVLGAGLEGGRHVDMQVAAVLVYDRALSATEQAQALSYLRENYLTPGGEDPTGDPASGKILYEETCFACHGSDGGGRFVRKSIRGASADRISSMISVWPAMNFLTYLTAGEIDDIAAYLDTLPGTSNELLTGNGDADHGETLFRTSCTSCHAMGTSPRVGPDLLGVVSGCANGGSGSGPRACEWVQAFIAEPKAMATHAYTEAELAGYPYIMSDLGLSDVDALDISAFLGERTNPLVPSDPLVLSPAAFEETKDVYFDRCAGCHGLYRTGATGPAIGEDRAQEIGADGLAAIMRHGTPGGMPNWGDSGVLSEEEIARLAAYLQLPPPEAPALGMPEIQQSWELLVPVGNRPAAPEHGRDWDNFFGVVLRDAGRVAIFDGDTHEEISRVDVGFAVHILRSSASGRYFYAIGRDGWVNLIDLWAATPNVVARVKGCHDARSVDSSKFAGYEDQYLIEGCYWPPQYVTYDGLTLEPQNRVDLPMTSIEGETLPEVRVAAIVASEYAPVWVVNQKETGYVGIVDYSQQAAPLVANIATERFLHDGGWDHTKRYFITAANASNKMVVVDVENEEFVTSFDVGGVPHPGRGANWLDPDYGWVNATPHISSPFISIFGADPENYPFNAWKVVRQIELEAAGSLFIKTHPNSPWVLVDMTLSSTNDKQICAIKKASGKLDRCIEVATAGKAVHMEFNEDGSEVWISDWAGEGGGQVILDATTLGVIKRIPLPATTGKFNVFNTAHDIY